MFLSFNGGKDCTVLLDLLIDVLEDIHNQNDIRKDLKIVYIRTKGPFHEIESFVNKVEEHYGVKLMVMEGEMKTTLQRILEKDNRLKACFMGTRRSDPYSEGLKFMQVCLQLTTFLKSKPSIGALNIFRWVKTTALVSVTNIHVYNYV